MPNGDHYYSAPVSHDMLATAQHNDEQLQNFSLLPLLSRSLSLLYHNYLENISYYTVILPPANHDHMSQFLFVARFSIPFTV